MASMPTSTQTFVSNFKLEPIGSFGQVLTPIMFSPFDIK
jgi:hypothetical protein